MPKTSPRRPNNASAWKKIKSRRPVRQNQFDRTLTGLARHMDNKLEATQEIVSEEHDLLVKRIETLEERIAQLEGAA